MSGRRTALARLLAVLVALALVAAACTDDAPSEDASSGRDDTETGGDDPGDDPEDLDDPEDDRPARWDEADCPEIETLSDDDIEDADGFCGTLTVPEDRAEPDGSDVVLPVLVIPADDGDHDDPIVYLEGGPGGDGLSMASTLLDQGWSAEHTLVFFDQRGTGAATPSLDCTNLDAALGDLLAMDASSPESDARYQELLVECRDDVLARGADLDHYNSAASATDVDDLRRVLGDELGFDEWTLFGISYGTRLALTVLRDHPDGVRSVILDSVYGPTRDLISEVGPNGAAAIDGLFASCAADLQCRTAFPDLAARWAALIERLEAEPLVIEGRSPDSGTRAEVLIDGETLVGLVFQLLYVTDIIPELPLLVDGFDAGDPAIEEYAAGLIVYFAEANTAGISEGLYSSVQCHEEVPFSTPEAVAAALEGLHPVVASAFDSSADFDDCVTWGTAPGPDLETEAVVSDVPTLLLAGGFDPITPVSWAEDAASTLENSLLVVIESAGHGAALTSCGREIALAFVDDPDDEPDLDCAEESDDIDWVVR